jgi:hypothetical protein
MRINVGESPTAGEQTQQKPCRTSSDIGVELENHTVGRGPIGVRKRKPTESDVSRCCIYKIRPPEDEQRTARNMYRI